MIPSPSRRLLPLAAVAALAACNGSGKAQLPTAPADGAAVAAAVSVKAQRPQAEAGAVVRATGEIRARHEATLSAEASGRIDRILVDVGSVVKAGQVLVVQDERAARIGVQQARAARAAADAAHRQAAADLKRAQALAREDATSPASLENAQLAEARAAAALEQADAGLASAEDNLRKQEIRAPFSGVITGRLKSAGEYVAMMPPTPVLSMVNLSTLEVRVPVPEAVADLLAPGALLDVTVSPSGKPLQARIRSIGSAVEAGTRTVDVRADPVGPMKELRTGAIVQVALARQPSAPAGVFLPAGVVQHEGSEAFVWVVAADTAHRRPVQVEKLGPGTVRVLTGVGPEDLVVAEAGAQLTDGAHVRVLQ
ncbi:MAG: efflux RND transporter periplasmic adaptor subunit [Anaeromyxobacter sp.]